MRRLLTIKEVARKTGASEYAIKNGVVDLLPLLPMKDQTKVMEHMLECKQLRNRKETHRSKKSLENGA